MTGTKAWCSTGSDGFIDLHLVVGGRYVAFLDSPAPPMASNAEPTILAKMSPEMVPELLSALNAVVAALGAI